MSRRRADLRIRICALALSLTFGLVGASPAQASPFEAWAAVVVAGDAKGSLGGPTEAFDNARRDLAKAFAGLGVAPDKIVQFSVRPEAEKAPRPEKATPRAIYSTLGALGASAAGCLVYVTSHGLPEGVVVDDQILPPQILGLMLDRSCGAKPTVVVISACYSGVFVPALAKPNRMILTAARPDRTGPLSAAARPTPTPISTPVSSPPWARSGTLSPWAVRWGSACATGKLRRA